MRYDDRLQQISHLISTDFSALAQKGGENGMTSLDRLAALSVQIVSLPMDSQKPMKSTSKGFKEMQSDSHQIRKSYPKELLVVKPQSGEAMAKLSGRLINAFMDPASMPIDSSIRLELEEIETGDKRSMSFEKPYYKFMQLRMGGKQTSTEDFEDIHFNGLDPKEAGVLRKAWWAAVRSVLDGLPIPDSARILLLGVRRFGGRSAFSYVMALVWTGKDYGVLKCHMDPTYLDCNMVCSGGVKEEVVTKALNGLKESKTKSFNDFAEAFETAVNEIMDSQEWEDQWSYPPMDVEDTDAYYQNEDILESYFHAFEQPDLGSWCFGK